MGVVNVTPDSFYDGGRHLDTDRAVAHALELARAGAQILDIGGESTRPGAETVPPRVQIERVLPVLRALRDATDAVLSIDTSSSAVAEAALDAGASIVNDVTAGRGDPAMARLVAGSACGVVIMHMQGSPRTMQQAPIYGDVVPEVRSFLLERAAQLEGQGTARERICLDPGIGFGKTLEHNLALLRHIDALVATGYPVLVGPSRKSFLGALLGRPVADRLWGTLAAVAWCALSGVAVVRVHDVAEASDVVRTCGAIRAESLPRE